MATNTRIPPAELSGLYGAMVKRMSSKMFGEVPEPVRVAWHNRKVLNLSFSLGRKMQKLDKCDENLKSFAHMATAGLVGCSFCLDYAEAMTQTPPTLTDELSARLLKALGPAALVELTMVIATANLMARSNVAMGITSQGFSATCDIKPLATTSTL